jgi:hypothetical protein
MEKRWPARLAPIFVVALPGSGAAPRPLRTAPRPFDESVHRFYAAQWFLFAAAIPALAIGLHRRRTAAGSAGATASRV